MSQDDVIEISSGVHLEPHIEGLNDSGLKVDPPAYTIAQRPTTDVSYTFSTAGPRSMMLVPPPDAQDTRPRYYITTGVNVFQPLANITTIYRGANEHGERIAEFEMGIISTGAKLKMRGFKGAISSVLERDDGSRVDGLWSWMPYARSTEKILRWQYTTVPANRAKCFRNKTEKVATYKFPGYTDSSMFMPNEITVTPEGHDYFDQIVISLMIIERIRLTPGRHHELKDLWNYRI